MQVSSINARRRLIRKSVLTALVLCVAGAAHAAGWVLNVQLASVIVGNNADGKYLQLVPAGQGAPGIVANPGGCASPDSYILRDSVIIDSAFTMALAAYTNGRWIRIYVSNTCDPTTFRPIATAIGVM